MMNPLMKSISNTAFTTNGAMSYASTGSANLDLFSKVGAARLMPEAELLNMFLHAAYENVDIATRIMMWVRDCRGGAGERSTFRKLLKEFESWADADLEKGPIVMSNVINKTVELGRWDDLFVLDKFFHLVVEKIVKGIHANDQLMLKWLPREKSAKSAIAKRIMKDLGMSPKQYRKMCSGVVTVETLMCAKKWEEVNLSHVPSVASSRYQKAFAKNHPGYMAWKAGLEAGTEKVNASVSFPHDVWRTAKSGGDLEVVQAMWDALPNYIPEGMNILPITDVSSSMSCQASGSLSCMDISISLGAYIATKNTGPFAGAMLTFDSIPKFHFMGKDNIGREMCRIRDMSWGGSTNFQASFDMILAHAVAVKAKQEEMPQYVLCVSDMQFNQAQGYHPKQTTNFDAVAAKYAAAGYKMPTLVFWQVNGNCRDVPATAEHKNVVLISGFSPAILKAVLTGKQVTPVDVMLDTVMVDKYKVL